MASARVSVDRSLVLGRVYCETCREQRQDFPQGKPKTRQDNPSPCHPGSPKRGLSIRSDRFSYQKHIAPGRVSHTRQVFTTEGTQHQAGFPTQGKFSKPRELSIRQGFPY